MIYWIKKMWHIYPVEYYAVMKKDQFMSFVGTFMKLETIIVSKLTQEQKNLTPHVLTHRRVLNNENTWTEGGSITHWSLLGRTRGGTLGQGGWGRITWGEMPDISEGEESSKPHCHGCTYATVLHVLHMYPKT